MISIAHFFTHFRTLGGVEAVLQQHYAKDSAWGMASRFVVLDEPPPAQSLERVEFLRLEPSTALRDARARLAALPKTPQPLVAIYHSAPVMRSFVCEADRAARRLLVLHGKGDGLEEALRGRETWLDGVVSVSEGPAQIARHCFPQLPAERFIILPVQVTSCAGLFEHAPLRGREVVLGYCGRLLKQHKRVDRLPELCRHLERLGVAYRLELLGDGPERAWLEGQFQGSERIRFLGRRGGEEYRRTLAAWDFIVFVSDTEGQPVALLEAMSGGVLPVFPKVNSAGDMYAETVDTRLLYPAGDVERAARAISEISQAPEEDTRPLRARCRKAVARNLDDTYFARFSEFARFVLSRERISTDRFPRCPSWLGPFPLAWISKAALIRRKWMARG